MTEQTTKYCIDCKWVHQEEFKSGVNATTDQVPEDYVYLCNHPDRRHLVTGKPVRLCTSEREGDRHYNCGTSAQFWEAKEPVEVDPATLKPGDVTGRDGEHYILKETIPGFSDESEREKFERAQKDLNRMTSEALDREIKRGSDKPQYVASGFFMTHIPPGKYSMITLHHADSEETYVIQTHRDMYDQIMLRRLEKQLDDCHEAFDEAMDETHE